MELDTVVCADFLDIAPTIADSSVNLLVSDWPYYKVKALDWDRQWSTPQEYLDWIGLVCEQYRRILAPNGSLYAFASPKLQARIEIEIDKHFNVLNQIIWLKPDGAGAEKGAKGGLTRTFIYQKEHIIFAEHYGADSAAKGESGYGAKCDELRGFVFEPLRAYLRGEWERASLGFELANEACGTVSMAARHYFARSQWCLPTKEHYSNLQRYINQQGHRPAPPYEDYHDAPRSRFERDHSEREYLRAEYEDLRAEYEDLRAEYEDLRAEYEDLRRPFNVTALDQYTDVWDFPTVKAYPGKHPCEKPPEMMEHIVKASSREGDVIGDFFCGSGGSLAAAFKRGRRYIGCDLLPKWAKCANDRIAKARLEMAQTEMAI
jgi:site-specific DNA-methyltransferase (adenine-specific)